MQIQNSHPKRVDRKKKRVGRGTGSGHGKTSTRGYNGSGQRKGRIHYIGHEGGNVPYLRRIPKRGFNSRNPTVFQIVNLDDIVKRLGDKKEITPEEMKNVNLVKDVNKPVKILSRFKGVLESKAVFKAHKFSKRAVDLIEKGGGKVECLAH